MKLDIYSFNFIRIVWISLKELDNWDKIRKRDTSELVT